MYGVHLFPEIPKRRLKRAEKPPTHGTSLPVSMVIHGKQLGFLRESLHRPKLMLP
jgi:hypothetical protein